MDKGMELNLFDVKINAVRASRIAIGKQSQVRKANSNKRNHGFGQQTGDRVSIVLPQTAIDDQEILDADAFMRNHF
ncbi:hypothetical protein [Paenibacillus abyssi]|uniref:Uncharacterized protein n=1 Tax=Paenibacillus abyssi TaxID=1340531 RepID=A0A917FNM7_9BACL|nr:hypothetical protein [Paenibacillus abyssi]GGF95971.1 hypothetical protein GCM10010916_11580 [Paenibacillus abyssi]